MLEITLSGCFDPPRAERFALEKYAAFERLGCSPSEHVTLVDASACLIQPQSAMAIFKGMLRNPQVRARRIAFVLQDPLAQMQIRRLLHGRVGECFSDRDQAEAWLLNPT